MKFARKVIILLLSLSLYAAACGGPQDSHSGSNSANASGNQANENANTSKDSAEELEFTIKLPYHPEDVVWREEPVEKDEERGTDPNAKKLTAVIKFLEEDAQKVVEQAERHRPAERVSITPEDWYPAELIAQSRMSGDQTVKGLSYAANDFFQPPYQQGRLTRIEQTDYFVLELFSR